MLFFFEITQQNILLTATSRETDASVRLQASKF